MPDEKLGIKETSEAMMGVNELTIFFATKFKDGVQLSDFTAFWEKLQSDEEFKKVMENAWSDYQKIPAEAKDIDLTEGLQLATLQISYIPRLVEAFRKPAVVNPVKEVEDKPADPGDENPPKETA